MTASRPVPIRIPVPDPVAATPPRRPRSIRRTTTHDCTHPGGLLAPVTLSARGRDLITMDGVGAEVVAEVVDQASLTLSALWADGLIRSVSMDPSDPGADGLVGASLYAGFWRHLDAALPAEAGSGSVRSQLLDDASITLKLSARARRVAGVPLSTGASSQGGSAVGICAGWVEGGMAHTGRNELGPPLTIGPLAPNVHGDDPLSWHDVDAQPPESTRRRRRIDAWHEGTTAYVDAWMRDSFVDADGVDTVVHEWSVAAEVDAETDVVTACVATMGPHPFVECPGSAASAARIVGSSLTDLRRMVRKELVGTSTCTHLNDTLRALQDVGSLLRMLQRG